MYVIQQDFSKLLKSGMTVGHWTENYTGPFLSFVDVDTMRTRIRLYLRCTT